MPLTPSGQMLQNLASTLLEVSRRLVRLEAKVTQLMLYQGMQSDGRQAIQPEDSGMTHTTPKQARWLAKRTEEGARHMSVETCDALRSLADQLEAVTEKRDFAVESAKGTADLCAQAIADLTAVTTERDALAVKLDHIAKTIDKQLRVIDERARGDFLDKRPVVQSLMMHARTARAAIAKEAK